ncbi:uncharacterized protein LOC122926793 [Bufo gargarizans]|uniref:uncharacterized protein LOC122926793 n=1 Tax=Bufo gargarizans TaxID=30331 RepID=UPI001CF37C4B|nr:uncharacterized protein LOC122926793 [Bufo gargarizans]
MAQGAEGAFVLHGRKAVLREKPYEFLSNTQKTTSSHNLSFQESANNRRLHGSRGEGRTFPDEFNGNTLSSYTKENLTIDDLEENLRKLQVQVDSLASSLNFESKRSNSSIHEWPNKMDDSLHKGTSDPTLASDWFLKSNHLNKPHEMFSTVQSSGLPTFSNLSISRPAVIGPFSELNSTSSSLTPSDIAYRESIPVKLGAPHIVGVKSLLPPKIAVRSGSPERTRVSTARGRSQSPDRSHSFSPDSKKTRWLRSSSQSPKPIWRPNSAKTNACAQPPPRMKSSGKTSSSNRQSRSRFYRPGTLVTRSFTPPRKMRSNLSYSWSPYSIPSSAISAPTAEEISNRFLKTLAGADVGISVVEASPYQQELTRLRLERLRVEEELLLEIKRQQELERTRGPKPKWYEMKNAQFHYEARKNNELLKTSKDYQSIFNYRQDLSASSKDFQEHFKISHLEPV